MNLLDKIDGYLNEMDYDKILKRAENLAAKATDGTLKVNGETYTLTFNPRHWHYVVTNSKNENVVNINAKKLSQAKKFLKHWLEN
jgi:hypothetical protein